MHWLWRILTAMVLFVFLFVVVYFAICIVGGAVSGGFAGASASQNSQDSFEAGRQAGENFVRHNIFLILGGSFFTALVGSVALSFTGIFPWCRKPKAPPRMM